MNDGAGKPSAHTKMIPRDGSWRGMVWMVWIQYLPGERKLNKFGLEASNLKKIQSIYLEPQTVSHITVEN